MDGGGKSGDGAEFRSCERDSRSRGTSNCEESSSLLPGEGEGAKPRREDTRDRDRCRCSAMARVTVRRKTSGLRAVNNDAEDEEEATWGAAGDETAKEP